MSDRHIPYTSEHQRFLQWLGYVNFRKITMQRYEVLILYEPSKPCIMLEPGGSSMTTLAFIMVFDAHPASNP